MGHPRRKVLYIGGGAMDSNGRQEFATIIVLGIVAVVAMWLLKVGGKEIALAIGTGLIGFLKGSSSGGGAK